MNLNQVTLPAVDLAASIAFYRLLGLRPIVVDAAYARFELPHGEATLSLETVDELPAAGRGVHVYFECDHLDAEVERLRAAGISFASGPEDQRWLWREAWLQDPAGNWLCLYHAGTNRKHPPWRVEC